MRDGNAAAADVRAAEQRAELERRRAEVERASGPHGAATQERLRITRELHDVIGHAMSVMVVQAGVAERLLDSQTRTARGGGVRDRQDGPHGRWRRCGSSWVCSARAMATASRSPRRPAPTLDDIDALAARVDGAGLPVDGHGGRGTGAGAARRRPRGVPGGAGGPHQLPQASERHARGRRRHLRADRAVEIEVVDDGRRPAVLAAARRDTQATAWRACANVSRSTTAI